MEDSIVTEIIGMSKAGGFEDDSIATESNIKSMSHSNAFQSGAISSFGGTT